MKTMLQLLMMWMPFIFGLSILTYVSVLDFKTRRVSNWVWIFAYPIGCTITLTNIIFNIIDVQTVLISVLCALFLGFALLCSGFYGSADAKALIFIGLTLPTIPLTFSPPLGVSALPIILTVFCNSAILSLVWPLSIFVLNLKDCFKGKNMFEEIQLTPRQKVWLLFTARLIPLTKLDGFWYFPSETAVIQEENNNKPNRKLLRLVKTETKIKKHIDNLKEHRELYKKGVLASPTIPTTVFFTAALVMAPLGNLLLLAATLFGGV